MQNAQAFQGQEGFYHVHLVGFAGHELAETAGGHYEGLAAQFFFIRLISPSIWPTKPKITPDRMAWMVSRQMALGV